MKNIEEIIENYKKTKTDKKWYFKSQKELESNNALTEFIVKHGLATDNNSLEVIINELKDDESVHEKIKAVNLVRKNNYKDISLILDQETTDKNLELQSSIIALLGNKRITNEYELLLKALNNPYHEIHQTALVTLSIYFKKELLEDKKNHLEIINKLMHIVENDYPEGNSSFVDCRFYAIQILGILANREDKVVLQLLEKISKKGFTFKSFMDRFTFTFRGKDEAKEALEKILKRKPK